MKKKINSRNKGADGERELARDELTPMGFPAKRGQQHKGGPDSPDVICDRLDDAGFQIECKRVQALNIHKAMHKLEGECGENKSGVIMHRKNGEPWLATIRLEDFLCLVDKAYPLEVEEDDFLDG